MKLEFARDLVGTCLEMCSEFERCDREVTQELHFFEMVFDGASRILSKGFGAVRLINNERRFRRLREVKRKRFLAWTMAKQLKSTVDRLQEKIQKYFLKTYDRPMC